MKFINILFLGIVFLSISCVNHDNTTYDASYYSMKNTLKEEKSKNSLLENLVITKSVINREAISESLKFINFKGDTITFKDYVEKEKTLVLYAGSRFCSSCFEEELTLLSDFASQHEKLKILVLARNISIRELIVNKKRNNYEFNIGVVPSPYILNEPIEEIGMPIYFIADKTMQTINSYVSQKQLLGLTEKYLEKIYETGFN